eukprot:TRINITY_DN8766_c0_g4_i1.p1 TRINITY_DN8766_c0_g4~~TRINITY_DN8766_c0_g4_i1.p1  ORF type:complete len:589 (-),score=139.37 TRINITY_DN8766_c0_g4_i1:44-1573(-)
MAVGALGTDDSLSLPLSRRRGRAVRSLPPERLLRSSSPNSISTCSSVPRAFLEEASSSEVPGLGENPIVGMALLAKLLLSPESTRQLLLRWALPALSKLLSKASPLDAARAIKTWGQALRPPAKTEVIGLEGSLCYSSFATATGMQDAATILLSLVAHLESKLLSRYCPEGTEAVLAEKLCARLVGKAGSSPQVQVMACEVLALSFPFWQRHLTTALPPSARQKQATGASNLTGAAGTPAVRPHETSGASAQAMPVDIKDEELERLAVQVLALCQEPHLKASSLALLMQVGAADPPTLLLVMGKAARRIDISAAYASSALFVLVAFVQRYAGKVLPLLTRFTETVLRCLEPSDPALRRQSLMAVTSALHELVQTFPMVDFHQPGQKIAVGTGDGLIVVYDLRTATKWRILEGHSGAVAALAFSEDGSRLCSYSGQDCSIRLWQTAAAGFLGSLMGPGTKCLKEQTLPPAATAAGANQAGRWKNCSLQWTQAGRVKLVRENGDALQLGMA